ncbi:MAG: pitrilysin family protein [Oscillospiraceae bacterium]|nr:pitrilysin family protein [Oscillospiraceae bacterium]
MNQKTELLPGVYLRAVQTDKFKTGCLSVNFLRPLCREEAALNALLPSVLLRGTKKHPDIQSISVLLDELYGAGVGTLVRKKGEVQTWGFYADFIEDEYTLAGENIFRAVCAFLRELLLEPLTEQGAFQQDFVEGEKVNLCNAIAAEINDKRTYAMTRLLRVMCREERSAVPRLGRRQEVEAITAESLYAHYRQTLAASRVELFYMGRKSPAEAAETMRGMLMGLPRETICSVGTEVVRTAGTVRYEEERMDVTQGKLAMGFRTGRTLHDPGFAALQMLNAVYGGSVTSKLFLNVREKLSLCYYASSSLEAHKGLMVVSSGIEFEQEAMAREEILRQLEDCRQGKITEEELENARTYLISTFQTALDSPGHIDDFFLGQAIAGLNGTMEARMDALRAVTREDVTAAAQDVQLDTVYFLKGAK